MFIAHPWHGIDHEFNGSEINGVIEISRGMKAKYEIDKKSGLLKLDRVLSTSFVYPINYGIFPKTLGEDGDPLDLLLLTQVEVEPLANFGIDTDFTGAKTWTFYGRQWE